MKIYLSEQKDGLSDLLAKSCANIECKFSTQKRDSFIDLLKELSVATDIKSVKDLIGQDQPDLAFIVSILVSAGWNLNDDIFVPVELWKAKCTPKHKPINSEHDETVILGHIIDSRPVDKDGNEIILTEADVLPEEFDLEVAGVLYKSLPQLKSKIDTILEQAGKGELFVSMECWFDDLAYGIKDPLTGKTTAVERKDDTAFLTKHLKVYGGNGEYKGYKIGRILKNIVFGGQGLVKNPANPESVIKIAANLKGGVENMDKEIEKKLEEALANLVNKDKQIEGLTKELESVKSANTVFATKIKEVTESIEQLTSQLQTAAEDMKNLETEKDVLSKKLEEVTAGAKKATDELEIIHKASVTKERFEKLSKVKNVAEKDKDATIKELSEMSDEIFNTVLKYASINSVKDDSVQASLDTVETKDDPEFQGGTEDVEDAFIKVALATAKCLLNKNEDKEGGE